VLGFYSVGIRLAFIPSREAMAPLLQTMFPALPACEAAAVGCASYFRAAFTTQAVTATARPLALALDKTRMLMYRDAAFMIVRVPLTVIGLLADGLTEVCRRPRSDARLFQRGVL
jgi:hypothetical protein